MDESTSRKADCADTPKNKKDQLSLAQGGEIWLRTGPILTTPGGWGLRNPESKGPGQRRDYLVAIQQGGRLAEVGRYYDSANDPVTARTCNFAWVFGRPGRAGPSVGRQY